MKIFNNKEIKFEIVLNEEIEYMKVLGKDVKFNTGNYVVTDNYSFWQIEKSFDSKEAAMEYVSKLLMCKNQQEYNFYKWCEKDGVKEGSIIQFEDGKKGVILGKEFAEGCLKYSPIKKNGTIGKAKRNLYGNIKYMVVQY
ncbi:TPA: hypothetical protein KPE78_001178 [Clostridioides difficile]|nr:hypothetical protein [Clostridioides difficile]OFU06793.1 hypothetical protein HMPREF3083_06565 [Clostridium sp. HMSC19D07]MBZ0554060.1 hypothetical protein [Clostridioides difficile]MCE4722491.1 hypothetical protein [Clostridioides difficile]MCG3580364.1 hypothetical protein [Clostridioides difficile]